MRDLLEILGGLGAGMLAVIIIDHGMTPMAYPAVLLLLSAFLYGGRKVMEEDP